MNTATPYVVTVLHGEELVFFHADDRDGFRTEVAHTAVLSEALGVAKVDANENGTTLHLRKPAVIESMRELHAFVSPTLGNVACKPEPLGDSGHSMRCMPIGAAVQAPQFSFDEEVLYAYLEAVPGVLEAVGYDYAALVQAWREQVREVQENLRPHAYELTNSGHVHFVAPDDASDAVMQEHAERAAALVDAFWVTLSWHETYADIAILN